MSSVSKYSASLPLMEHFYTVQGEGFHQGKASYFIRIGGCDIGCVWCDVKDSWDAAKFAALPVGDIVNHVVQSGAKICVVTGGEPMMHDLAPLTAALHAKGIKAHVETSGAYEISGDWDWICVSPKRFKLPVDSSLLKASELKVVVFHKNDFRLAEEYQPKISPSCKLFLQPEWSKEKEMLPLMIDYVKANQQWEISLQIHKYMDIP